MTSLDSLKCTEPHEESGECRLFPVEWSGAGNLAVAGKGGGQGGKPVGSSPVLGFPYILRGTS